MTRPATWSYRPDVRASGPPEFLFPPYRDFLERTGLTSAAYFNPGRYTTGTIKSDGSGADASFVVNNTPTFDYAVNGYRGIYIDADGAGIKATGYEPGLASMLMIEAFCVLADPGAQRSLSGKTSTDAARFWVSQITASDLVSVYIEDSTGHGDANAGGADQGPLSYGVDHIYLFSKFLDRRALTYPSGNAMRTRLSKYGYGRVGAEYTKNITAVTTLTGGASPTLSVGAMPGVMNGAGVVNLGFVIATGAQIEVDGILQLCAQALEAE